MSKGLSLQPSAACLEQQQQQRKWRDNRAVGGETGQQASRWEREKRRGRLKFSWMTATSKGPKVENTTADLFSELTNILQYSFLHHQPQGHLQNFIKNEYTLQRSHNQFQLKKKSPPSCTVSKMYIDFL